MTTISRPVIYDEAAITAGDITADDTNLTGPDWAGINLKTVGVDAGMNLTLSSISDVGTISIGSGVWRGFELSVTAAHDVNLPAVATAKTYSIGVLFNPANYSTVAGPLSLAVFDKAAITVPSGGAFWTLWEVDRLPSSVLSTSTVRTYRSNRSGVVYCTLLPPPAEYEFGTVAVTATSSWVRDIAGSAPTWKRIVDDTDWVTAGFTPGSEFANAGSRYRVLDGVTTTQVVVTCSNAGFFFDANGNRSDDPPLVTVPALARPSLVEVSTRGYFRTQAGTSTAGVDMVLKTSGVVELVSAIPSLSVPNGARFAGTFTFLK